MLAIDAGLIIKASGSLGAVRKLAAGDALTSGEQIALGRLNSHCFIHGYEPLVLLFDRPRIDPSLPELMRTYPEAFSD